MRQYKAFTLIEVIAVLAILSIFLLLIYPDLKALAVKSYRNNGLVALYDLSSRLERYHSQNRTYVGATIANLGLSSSVATGGHYNLVFQSLGADTFTVQAVPLGYQSSNDKECEKLSLNQHGHKSISGSGTISGCWGEN